MEIGDKVRFKPAAFLDSTAGYGLPSDQRVEVTGTVEYINEAHRFYRVVYELPGCIGHECFKF